MKKEPVRNALLEIGTEEIPARFMPPTLQSLAEFAAAALAEAGIAHGGVETWGTPRRITLFIKGIAPRSSDRTDVAVGPPPKAAKDAAGKWTAAATGFAKAQKISVEKLVVQQTPKGERYVALHDVKGQKTETVLKELFPALVRKLSFPKSMIWDSPDFRFARPVRWFLALYNNNVVRFRLAGLASDRNTIGLLALGANRIAVSRPEKYRTILQGRCILVDPAERRHNISAQIEAICKRIKSSAIVSDEHLDEVVHLTEYPVSILGHFPEAYLKLPREVLVTVLKKHQKFFPVESSKGQLTNAFIGVRNGPSESQDDVRDGYERVINARFSDAQFFFEKDSQTPLPAMVEKLAGIGFHAKLGTMLDKTRRVEALVALIGERAGLPGAVRDLASRGAALSKVDLLTQMVGELPELQGVAGRFYADRQGLPVGQVIEQHYWPLTADGTLPQSEEAALVALADKMDTLAANFSVGLVPTGSADPYGLRRAAIGVIRILLDRKWNVSLGALIGIASERFQGEGAASAGVLQDFFRQRLTAWLENQGFRTDEIEAVLALDSREVSLAKIFEHLNALRSVRSRPEFDLLAGAIKRAQNLVRDAEKKGLIDPATYAQMLSAVFESGAEENLRKALEQTSSMIQAIGHGQIDRAMLELATLKDPVDEFFKNVMVMAEDPQARARRLYLLKLVRDLFGEFADFSKLQAGAPASS